MENYILEETEETPAVNFNIETGVFEITGRSYPENPFDFYQPLLNWLQEYFDNKNGPMKIALEMDYFNSSSGRYILEILTKAETWVNKGNEGKLLWRVDDGDELMIEKGEEYRELLALPVEIELLE